MRALIGCEQTGVIRREFRRRGWDAWSCDLSPSADGGPHLQGDLLEYLDQDWDLIIAHPPCRYLSVSGMHWTTRGFRDPADTEAAIRFAEWIWQAPCNRICIENSVGVLSTRSALGRPSQTIQPYEFGEDASKRTCLWLRGLPLLRPTRHVKPRMVNGRPRWANQTDSGQNRLGPSEDRWLLRSKTYPGIAAAMADQWTENFQQTLL